MIVGREAELHRLTALTEAARGGSGSALVLTGPPGIGKSALLQHVAGTDHGLRVVSVQGVESERDLPHAGLHAALGPLLPLVPDLPAPEAAALRTVLGVGPGAGAGAGAGSPPGPLLVGLATLHVLAGAGGVLLLVDDLPWLDRPSADALTFAARRLAAEPVALVATARTGPGEPSAPVAGLPTLELPPLSAPAALLPTLAPEVATALAAATGGNPLAMLDIAAALSPEEAAGTRPLPTLLPPTDPEAPYSAALARLPPRPRAAARVLATAAGAPCEVVLAALAAGGLREGDLAAVEDTGLVRLAECAVWRHPLVRSAAARGTAAERREAHRLAAAGWAGRPGPARAWHLAGAADGPDEVAAAALREAAGSAESAGAAADAADAWERSARLTEAAGPRSTLLERAATAALRAGQTARASALLDEALQHQAGPGPAARLLHLRGRIEHTLGAPARALDLLSQAVDLSSDPDVRVRAAAEGIFAAMYGRRPDAAARMAALVERHHDPADPVHRFLLHHARGAAAALGGDDAAARAHLDRARSAVDDAMVAAEPALLLWVVNADLFAPGDRPAAVDVPAAVAAMRASGDLTWLPRVVRLAALREVDQGRWARAEGWLLEAELVSRVAGQPTQLAEALLALAELDALRGHRDQAQHRAAEARVLVEQLDLPWVGRGLDLVAVRLALTEGRPQDALAPLRRLGPRDVEDLALLLELTRQVEGDQAARRAADELAAGAGTDVRRVVDALLAADDRTIGEGLALAAAAATSLAGALLRVRAGDRLRRAGERRRAREELRTAREVLVAAGAQPWVDRCDELLRASGATLRRDGRGEDLTPSERRVAGLVAQGRSNKEVAAELFLSPKTVEFHLGRAYRKLGVANRTALARALPPG